MKKEKSSTPGLTKLPPIAPGWLSMLSKQAFILQALDPLLYLCKLGRGLTEPKNTPGPDSRIPRFPGDEWNARGLLRVRNSRRYANEHPFSLPPSFSITKRWWYKGKRSLKIPWNTPNDDKFQSRDRCRPVPGTRIANPLEPWHKDYCTGSEGSGKKYPIIIGVGKEERPIPLLYGWEWEIWHLFVWV